MGLRFTVQFSPCKPPVNHCFFPINRHFLLTGLQVYRVINKLHIFVYFSAFAKNDKKNSILTVFKNTCKPCKPCKPFYIFRYIQPYYSGLQEITTVYRKSLQYIRSAIVFVFVVSSVNLCTEHLYFTEAFHNTNKLFQH